MNKKAFTFLALIGIALVVGLWLLNYFSVSQPIPEPTAQEAAEEVEQAETSEDAAGLTIEKIDQELTGTSEADFSGEEISPEALEL